MKTSLHTKGMAGSNGLRFWARWLAVFSVAFACSGCLVIPVPEAGRKVTASYRQKAAGLLATSASREVVVNTFGTPTMDFRDLRVSAYRWSGSEWGVCWAYVVAGGYQAAADCGYEEIHIQRVLWLGFDEQDRLERWQLARYPALETRTRWELARRWRESKGPPLAGLPPEHFVVAAPPPGQALLHVFWAKGNAWTGAQNVTIDGVPRAEIRKGAFTTFDLAPGSHQVGIPGRTLNVDLLADQVSLVEIRPAKSETGSVLELLSRSETDPLACLHGLAYCK